MRIRVLFPILLVAVAALVLASAGASEQGEPSAELRPASAFASIENPAERSAALFTEAGKVLQHPRCVNCHPAGDTPLQGEMGSAHEPPVKRGRVGMGVVGQRCDTCHLKANYDPARVPGAPHWRLAPLGMAWEGLDLAEICEQLKDPARNGGRNLEMIVEHMVEDELVGWGWEPGEGRESAPGTQKVFGELIAAWVEAGAECPSPDADS